jgi:hypothetical protein
MAPHDSASTLSRIVAYTRAGQVERRRSLGVMPECAPTMTKVLAYPKGKIRPLPPQNLHGDRGASLEQNLDVGIEGELHT